MTTLIAIPCMDEVDAAFAQSLVRLKPVGDAMPVFQVGSLVYDSRNQLGQIAMQNDCEYILWLDSDMTFQPDLMERLYQSIEGKDFVSGLYFTRKREPKPCIYDDCSFHMNDDGSVHPVAHNYFDYPKDSLFEIQACGFGAVLMRTSLYQAIYEKKGLPFSPVLGFGEDLSFCMRARELGFRLYCDSSVKCGHIKKVEMNEMLYLLQQDKIIKENRNAE